MTPGNPNDPATRKQLNRLAWWAEKIGTKVPADLTKAQASDLISEWANNHEEFLDAWEEHADELRQRDADERERKEASEFREMEIQVIAGDVDDWREFYNCRRVPKALLKRVLGAIGSKGSAEPIDQFMDRFFKALQGEAPQLFSAAAAPPKISTENSQKKSTHPVQKPPMPQPTRPTFITPGTVVSHSPYRPVQRPSNAGPAIASLLLPGLGQMVQGRVVAAAFWFVASGVIWFLTMAVGLFGLGTVANVFSAIDAARWDGRN